MNNYIHCSDYFYGNKVSDYGIEHGHVDYDTLAKSFDLILNNDILQRTWDTCAWEPVNGCETRYISTDGSIITESEYFDLPSDEQSKYEELYENVYQWFIISEFGYEVLSRCTNEIVYYSEPLNMYLWGVTHYGTSWDYVLTDIKIDLNKEA